VLVLVLFSIIQSGIDREVVTTKKRLELFFLETRHLGVAFFGGQVRDETKTISSTVTRESLAHLEKFYIMLFHTASVDYLSVKLRVFFTFGI
jgi:hypothetical protein